MADDDTLIPLQSGAAAAAAADATKALPTSALTPGTGVVTPNVSIVGSSLVNAYDTPGAWNTITIGALVLPGVVISIDGHTKPDTWTAQKGTGTSNATTVWKGLALAEKITIVIELPNRATFAAYYAVRDKLRPKRGTLPPSFPIVNAAINFSGITRISCIDVEPPKPSAGNSWRGTITLIEYNPSAPASTGPAAAAKNVPTQPTANDQAASELNDAINQAKAIS